MFELYDPQLPVRVQSGANLPHWYQPGVSYFVTFRTEDSIPAEVSRRWHAAQAEWLSRHGVGRESELPAEIRRQYHQSFSSQYLEALDKGLGACVLRRETLRHIVRDVLLYFDGQRYHMGDFVIMPNHVHLIVGLLGETEMEAQCTSWKRYTARQINQHLGRVGRFWQEESFDHLIRSPQQFEWTRKYIRDNGRHLPAGDYTYYKRPS